MREVERVKRRQHGIIVDPYTIEPEAELGEAADVMRRTGVGTLVVVDEARRVVGLLTTRDLRFSGATGRVRDRMTPRDDLIVREGVIDGAAAEDVMRAHKIKKLPLVDAAWAPARPGHGEGSDQAETVAGRDARLARPPAWSARRSAPKATTSSAPPSSCAPAPTSSSSTSPTATRW